MFQELMPLLARRRLVLLVNRMDAGTLRVSVIPQPDKDNKEHDEALNTPLSLTGTPEELDRELPRQLVQFVAAHLELSSTLDSVKRQLEASTKKARENARKTSTGATTRSPAALASTGTTPIAEDTDDDTSESGPGKEGVSGATSTTPSLFATSND